MLLRELFIALDEGLTWARRGKNVVRKYRCSNGPRNGRVVAKMQQCFSPFNIKARVRMKNLQSRLGQKMARKAKKTKRTNPASVRLKRLNKKK